MSEFITKNEHDSRLVSHLDLAQFYLGHALHAVRDAHHEATQSDHHRGKWGCLALESLVKTTQGIALRMGTDFRSINNLGQCAQDCTALRVRVNGEKR